MKVGFCTGVFDLFHAGHEHFLLNCEMRCQYLIVAVNHDRWCQRKGPARPFDNLAERMARVARVLEISKSRYRFSVIPFSGNDLALAAEINPDVIFRGWDQREDAGLIPVVRIGQLPGFSTTLLASIKEP
jgi:bifunctional ADP-heptose synthase (sugar kinase/adenylyltransferase)